MSDEKVIRAGGISFEERFKRILAAYITHVANVLADDAREPAKDTAEDMRIIQMKTFELLDEYGIVVTKRLEGTLVSTEESLPLSPNDLAQLIPALRSRLRLLKRGNHVNDMAYTERLLAQAEQMLDAYGPAEPDDVLWPVVERRGKP